MLFQMPPYKDGSMISLYHYTDHDGFHGIIEAGYIRTSDGHYGQAVYLTSMSPGGERFKAIKT